MSYLLSHTHIDALIMGLSQDNSVEKRLKLKRIVLTEMEIQRIQTCSSTLTGDVYALERDKEGRHGAIMKNIT